MTAKIEPCTDKFDEWFVAEWGPQYIGTREYSIMHGAWCASIGKTKEIMDELVKENEQLTIDVECDVYCKVCGSCGEDGCCRPEICRGGKHCMYPDYGKPHEYAAREKRDAILNEQGERP